jgi:hypothetical protein
MQNKSKKIKKIKYHPMSVDTMMRLLFMSCFDDNMNPHQEFDIEMCCRLVVADICCLDNLKNAVITPEYVIAAMLDFNRILRFRDENIDILEPKNKSKNKKLKRIK